MHCNSSTNSITSFFFVFSRNFLEETKAWQKKIATANSYTVWDSLEAISFCYHTPTKLYKFIANYKEKWATLIRSKKKISSRFFVILCSLNDIIIIFIFVFFLLCTPYTDPFSNCTQFAGCFFHHSWVNIFSNCLYVSFCA